MRHIKPYYDSDKEWVMDPKGYFIIRVFYSEGLIGVRHYPPDELGSDAVCDAEIKGKVPYDIVQTAIREGLVGTLQHAAYLGYELYRAWVALKKGLEYIQDADLDFSKKYSKDPSENIKKESTN